MKRRQWLLEICAFFLAVLFLYTGLSKAIDLEKFRKEINNQPFDDILTPYLTLGIPLIELILTILILWPRTRLWGFYVSFLLMAVFTTYVALVTFNFYERMPCGCATAFEKLSWPEHLIVNTFFTAVAATGVSLERKQRKEEGIIPSHL